MSCDGQIPEGHRYALSTLFSPAQDGVPGKYEYGVVDNVYVVPRKVWEDALAQGVLDDLYEQRTAKFFFSQVGVPEAPWPGYTYGQALAAVLGRARGDQFCWAVEMLFEDVFFANVLTCPFEGDVFVVFHAFGDSDWEGCSRWEEFLKSCASSQ